MTSPALESFFGSFSSLANAGRIPLLPLALQQGEVLAGRMRTHGRVRALDEQVGETINATVAACNELLESMLNGEIGAAEGNGQEASELRDQRDLLIDQLSVHVDIEVTEQPGGMVDIRIGSTPILLGDQSLGLAVEEHAVDGVVQLSLHAGAHGAQVQLDGGTLHGLFRQHSETIAPAMETLNQLASSLIHHVNRLHSQGQGENGWASLTGTVGVQDVTAVLNDTAAAAITPIGNGEFTIHLRDPESGVTTRSRFRSMAMSEPGESRRFDQCPDRWCCPHPSVDGQLAQLPEARTDLSTTPAVHCRSGVAITGTDASVSASTPNCCGLDCWPSVRGM